MSTSYHVAFEIVKKFLCERGVSVNFDFLEAEALGFRHKAKLAVRGTYHAPQVGIFKKGTHDVVDMGCCQLHHPSIQNFIKVLKEAIKTFQIEPYDEIRSQGVLRYIQALVNERGALQVVLVLNQKMDCLSQVVEFFKTRTSLVSIWINYQKEVSNTIFGDRFEHVGLDDYLPYHIMNKKIWFHPGSFCQANLLFFANILKDIQKRLPPLIKALDLYCGVGLFGVVLSEKFKRVLFAENNPYSFESFKKICKSQSLDNSQFYLGNALNLLQQHLDADCVILDPPRKGLHKDVKPLLGLLKKESYLVYVSCGHESFMRDTKELLNLGFVIEFIKGYDCFVGTGEIEILCLFKKSG